MHWRLLVSPPARGVENMALDDALLDRARRTGEAVWRVYTWSRPALSLGRHQTAQDRFDPGRAAARGIDIVRRPTGGRALLHHREITYSVTAPARPGESLRADYEFVNTMLLDALRRLGVAAHRAAPRARAPLPTDAPCFETPTAGELVVEGRKLVGSAQWRDEDAWLQHGSILIDDDQSWIAELARHPLPAVPPPATLREALGRAPDTADAAAAMAAAVRAHADADAEPLVVDEALAAAVALRCARYADPVWTWRR